MLKNIAVSVAFGLVLWYFGTSFYEYWNEPEVQVSATSGKPVKLLTVDGGVVNLVSTDELPRRYSKVIIK